MAVWDFFLNVQHTGWELTAVNLVKQLGVHLLNTLVGFPCVSASQESACNAGDLGLILGLGRSPGERKGYPLQYSGLENSMECIVHGVSKSRTQLCDFHLYIKNVYICILYRARYFCLPHQTHVIHISTSRTWFSASCFLTYLNGLTSSLVL